MTPEEFKQQYDELMRLKPDSYDNDKKYPTTSSSQCPNCGYCPSCGRPYHWNYNIPPYWWLPYSGSPTCGTAV